MGPEVAGVERFAISQLGGCLLLGGAAACFGGDVRRRTAGECGACPQCDLADARVGESEYGHAEARGAPEVQSGVVEIQLAELVDREPDHRPAAVAEEEPN